MSETGLAGTNIARLARGVLPDAGRTSAALLMGACPAIGRRSGQRVLAHFAPAPGRLGSLAARPGRHPRIRSSAAGIRRRSGRTGCGTGDHSGSFQLCRGRRTNHGARARANRHRSRPLAVVAVFLLFSSCSKMHLRFPRPQRRRGGRLCALGPLCGRGYRRAGGVAEARDALSL